MSLEKDIQLLTAAIIGLTNTLVALQPQPAANAPAPAPVPAAPVVSPAPAPVAQQPAMPPVPFPNTPTPAPAAPVAAAPVFQPQAAPAFAAPQAPAPVFQPAAAPAVRPFNDAKGAVDYVIAKFTALGPQKGQAIQSVITSLGIQNINLIQPAQYDALFAGVEAIV